MKLTNAGWYWAALGGGLICLASLTADAQTLRAVRLVKLDGDLAFADELSGVALWRDLLIACPDEGAEFNVLRNSGTGYELISKVNLLRGSDEEIDMEGAASDQNHIYIIGSHSLRRKQVDEDGAYRKNRKRLTRVTPHSESYSLFRITLSDDGELLSNERISLRDILEADDILRPYLTVPGKENGIDIEGVAVKDGKVFVGFRGPVLRGNFVPVLSFEFAHPEEYELQFVKLDGRGIRDLTAVDDGFLILAGPVGDGDASYQLHLWNGEDCVPGDEESAGRVTILGDVTTDKNMKPEGLVAAADNSRQWRLLLLRDGDDGAIELVVGKP